MRLTSVFVYYHTEVSRMLVLSRNVNERILVGDQVEIQICQIRNGRVKIGVTAPDTVKVLRAELIAGSEVPNPGDRTPPQ